MWLLLRFFSSYGPREEGRPTLSSHTAFQSHASVFTRPCLPQVYQDLCKKHPTFRERSERVDLSVSPTATRSSASDPDHSAAHNPSTHATTQLALPRRKPCHRPSLLSHRHTALTTFPAHLSLQRPGGDLPAAVARVQARRRDSLL
jgi:hypothetical protein